MITTERDLLQRLQVPAETAAIAAQTVPGGVKAYLRALIVEGGEMRVLGIERGKCYRAGECFEATYREPLVKKRKAARK